VKPANAILYSVAQCLGALGGVGVFALIGGTFTKSVQLGLTLPGEGYSPAVAFVPEADHLPPDVSGLVLCRQFTNRRTDSVLCCFNSNGFTGSHPSVEHWPLFQASGRPSRTAEMLPIAAGSLTMIDSTLFLSFAGAMADSSSRPGAQVAGSEICSN
jgi:hypothetical protein